MADLVRFHWEAISLGDETFDGIVLNFESFKFETQGNKLLRQ